MGFERAFSYEYCVRIIMESKSEIVAKQFDDLSKLII
jgi:hypothetical protein